MVTSPAAPLALSPHTQPVQTRHGLMRANPDDFHPGRALLEYGACCELESAVLRQLLVRPGVVVEVGANIGVHTVALAREARPRRQVRVAFEPQPVIFQNLGANLAANGITNVLAWPYACGSDAGTLYFARPDYASPDYASPGNFGAVSMQAGPAASTIPVPCVRLDDALRSHTVSLIRLDVEGFVSRAAGRSGDARALPPDALRGERPAGPLAGTDRMVVVEAIPAVVASATAV
ncbi:MAG TPA: FkbM family methyltransferase [Paraburkholderia sp.]|jgi:FkbM family methyltransferase|nr:FkbM family methyltransferase [Paraburkholderia sp.]